MERKDYAWIVGNQQGSALIVSVILLVVLLLIGGAALKIANTETQVSRNDYNAKQAFQAAETASEYYAAQLANYLANSLLRVPNLPTINSSIPPPPLNGYTLEESAPITFLSQDNKNATGIYSGLTAWCQRYRVTNTACASDGRSRATVIRLLEDQLIPLFQFGVFYQNLLEIFPGAEMTFNGRIHSNSNIQLGTHATLTINQQMTAAGSVTRYQPGTHHGQNFSGTVTVSSQTENVSPLTLPIPQGNDPISMIQRGNEEYRLMSKAGLRIIDGVAYDKNNNVINLSACGSNNPVSSSTVTFKDWREGKTVSARQIDLAKLQNCPAAYNALNNPPSGGDQGVLYVSETQAGSNLAAVRLVNGANLNNSTALPAGLTVATDNPLYVRGDFNTTPRDGYPVPAALASDALTILSNSWNSTTDSTYSFENSLSNRVASNTTVNAAILTGNVPTTDPITGNGYSGGLENFPRFLENWTNRTFTYGGSMVCLWQSQRATGQWAYGSPRYTAPNRAWSYNMHPTDLPPGTPRVRNMQRIQWYQVRR